MIHTADHGLEAHVRGKTSIGFIAHARKESRGQLASLFAVGDRLQVLTPQRDARTTVPVHKMLPTVDQLLYYFKFLITAATDQWVIAGRPASLHLCPVERVGRLYWEEASKVSPYRRRTHRRNTTATLFPFGSRLFREAAAHHCTTRTASNTTLVDFSPECSFECLTMIFFLMIERAAACFLKTLRDLMFVLQASSLKIETGMPSISPLTTINLSTGIGISPLVRAAATFSTTGTRKRNLGLKHSTGVHLFF